MSERKEPQPGKEKPSISEQVENFGDTIEKDQEKAIEIAQTVFGEFEDKILGCSYEKAEEVGAQTPAVAYAFARQYQDIDIMKQLTNEARETDQEKGTGRDYEISQLRQFALPLNLGLQTIARHQSEKSKAAKNGDRDVYHHKKRIDQELKGLTDYVKLIYKFTQQMKRDQQVMNFD